MDFHLLDGVVIVQNQHIAGRDLIQFIDEAVGQSLYGRFFRRIEKSQGVFQGMGKDGANGSEKTVEKLKEVVIMFVQGDPGLGNAHCFQPASDQGCLTVSRGGGDES